MGQIPRDRRITARREIRSLLEGRSERNAILELFWRPPRAERSRATCITPKHGHTNVERNRLRRRIKEIMTASLLTLSEPRDYLVRARPIAYDESFAGLQAAMLELVARMERRS